MFTKKAAIFNSRLFVYFGFFYFSRLNDQIRKFTLTMTTEEVKSRLWQLCRNLFFYDSFRFWDSVLKCFPLHLRENTKISNAFSIFQLSDNLYFHIFQATMNLLLHFSLKYNSSRIKWVKPNYQITKGYLPTALRSASKSCIRRCLEKRLMWSAYSGFLGGRCPIISLKI